MKSLIGALGLALLVSPALAQTPAAPAAAPIAAPAYQSTCAVYPPAPAAPDGAKASDAEMLKAEKEMKAWHAKVQARHECLKAEFNQTKAKLQEIKRLDDVTFSDSKQATDLWSQALAAFKAKKGKS